MRFLLPTPELQIFGFNDNDINNLKKILLSNHLKDFIKVEEINGQLFDFGAFVKEVLSSKSFRDNVIKSCYSELNDFPNCILNNMTLVPNNLSFKLNLFLLLIDSLNKNNSVNPLYLQFLEIDKRAKRNTNTLVDAFSEMCRLNLYNLINVVNLFADSNILERTGWTGTNVPTPHKESIAEHMYFMYTLANIYLPEESLEDGYSKEKILDMIMIHDLAETLTGDIPHPNKTSQDDIKEDLIAKALWCSLLYNEASNANKVYDAWVDWTLNISYNANLAHDFDAIQLNYQFFTYACKYPETYTDQNILSWTRRQPKTPLGKEIYKKIILENPKFKSRIGVIYGKY